MTAADFPPPRGLFTFADVRRWFAHCPVSDETLDAITDAITREDRTVETGRAST